MSIDLVKDLLISTNWKSENYKFILMIVNYLTKIVYYKPIKITIDIPGLVEVIINVVMRHHSILKLIIIDGSLLFILKF